MSTIENMIILGAHGRVGQYLIKLVAKSNIKARTSALKGHDAVILAVGSGGKNLLQVDLDGYVEVFEANSRSKYTTQTVFLIDEVERKLDYTIVKPTWLTDESPTGKIKVLKGIIEDPGTVTRADVAQVLFDVLNFKDTFGKSFDIANGDKSSNDPRTYQ
ncbi:hypothetical protein KGF57_003884 [Candida theae]|uniref:NAD(P)-binding domain-containing protein n=1 Tax=Candida theae TaxID=1198502 RepID=A0AAD5BCI1_9ASCO|nr:uncharacterized protein KGF57_003884 [Candida theae]KAI5954859.1 hypothetical protein KGF57_003884 [Candida theae]